MTGCLANTLPPFPGPVRLQSTPSLVVPMFQHCCLPKLPAQDVLEGLVRPTLHSSTVMGHSSSGSLRSPCGFQCFPLEEIIQGADADRSFRIDPRSCEQASPVIRHYVSVCISSSALVHVHKSIHYTPKCEVSFSCGPAYLTSRSGARPISSDLHRI